MLTLKLSYNWIRTANLQLSEATSLPTGPQPLLSESYFTSQCQDRLCYYVTLLVLISHFNSQKGKCTCIVCILSCTSKHSAFLHFPPQLFTLRCNVVDTINIHCTGRESVTESNNLTDLSIELNLVGGRWIFALL